MNYISLMEFSLSLVFPCSIYSYLCHHSGMTLFGGPGAQCLRSLFISFPHFAYRGPLEEGPVLLEDVDLTDTAYNEREPP